MATAASPTLQLATPVPAVPDMPVKRATSKNAGNKSPKAQAARATKPKIPPNVIFTPIMIVKENDIVSRK